MAVLPGITYAYVTATPFPGTKDGINIKSLDSVDVSTKEKIIKHFKISHQKNAYINTSATDEDFNSLYNIPKVSKQETNKYDNNPNPLDTHLRSDISKLRLSFKFLGVPGLSKDNIIGFAPAGGYTHEKGWDGIVEFFEMPNMGVCSFTTFSIKSAILYKEAIEYLVNKKPSEKDISGNWNAGFIYKLNWYTNNRRNSLECASKNLDDGYMDKMVLIANQVDNELIN